MASTPTRVELIVNGSASGTQKRWAGGRGTFSVAGTFGGATVKLQYLGPDEATWIDVGPEVTLTAAGAGGFELAPGLLKAVITGGSPSGIYALAHRN